MRRHGWRWPGGSLALPLGQRLGRRAAWLDGRAHLVPVRAWEQAARVGVVGHRSGYQRAISEAADSGESDACTALWRVDSA